MNVRPLLKNMAMWARKNAPKILAGLAIASEAAGFYFMHKEAPVVRDRLKELPDDATWKDKIKAAGPIYLPAMGMLILSSGCIITGCVAGERKAALLTGLYSASEAALRKYEEKVVDVLGKEKAQELHDEMAKDTLKDIQVTDSSIVYTGNGADLFLEPLTGRIIASSKQAIKNAETDAKAKIQEVDWVTVNQWFDYLNIDRARLGGYAGWNKDSKIDIGFDTGWTNDGRPCGVIYYYNMPVLYNGHEPVVNEF